MLMSLLLMVLPASWAHPFRQVVLSIVSPIDRVLVGSTEFFTRISRAVVTDTDDPSELKRLHDEVRALQSQRDAAVAETARLNRTIKSMIDCKTLTDASPLNPFPVDVIEKPTKVLGVMQRTRGTMRIAAGRTSGIAEGDAVVHQKYVVGRVIWAGLDSSQVQLVTDPGFRAAAVTHPWGVEGTVHGEADTHCILKHVLKSDRVEPRDLVLTSGFAGVFPRGFVVGHVSKVASTYDARVPRVEVVPAIVPQDLETVLVLVKPPGSQ